MCEEGGDRLVTNVKQIFIVECLRTGLGISLCFIFWIEIKAELCIGLNRINASGLFYIKETAVSTQITDLF